MSYQFDTATLKPATLAVKTTRDTSVPANRILVRRTARAQRRQFRSI